MLVFIMAFRLALKFWQLQEVTSLLDLWLSVGDGIFSENRAVGKMAFPSLKAALKIWGSGPKEEEYRAGVKVA